MKNELLYKKPKQKKDTSRQDLVASVIKDFEDRKLKRKSYELQWRLNAEFLHGNQNSYVTTMDTLATLGRQFHWQQREVFNHIAPIIEGRLAKLNDLLENRHQEGEDEQVAPEVCYVPSAVCRAATQWSEVVGTVFYKIVWNDKRGQVLGAEEDGALIYQGEAEVIVISPHEIYPDNLEATNMEEVRNLIHAKELPVEVVDELWGIDLSGTEKKTVVVIERYEAPTKLHPNGRLLIVAHDRLAYDGELPFINGEDDSRTFPFIRQTSEDYVGSFFGKSIIERAIPVQRAYNNVKNRKAEFMARLACGVLAVEDGSVDLDNLEQDGLAPGKVIVYRQGMSAPTFLDTGSIPAELANEEEKLLAEFELISGGGDIARQQFGSTSGTALEILVEKDRARLSRTLSNLQAARAAVNTHIVRLRRQFGVV